MSERCGCVGDRIVGNQNIKASQIQCDSVGVRGIDMTDPVAQNLHPLAGVQPQCGVAGVLNRIVPHNGIFTG